jgi:hypothetical protein
MFRIHLFQMVEVCACDHGSTRMNQIDVVLARNEPHVIQSYYGGVENELLTYRFLSELDYSKGVKVHTVWVDGCNSPRDMLWCGSERRGSRLGPPHITESE